jgi:hypothetical protein
LIILDENILDAQRLLLEASRIRRRGRVAPAVTDSAHTVWNRPT